MIKQSGNIKTNSTPDVQSYSFSELEGETSGAVADFQMPDLSSVMKNKEVVPSKQLRTEREHASQNMFKISSAVKHHRGITKQEEDDYEKSVSTEVETRLAKIKEEAYKNGYEEGLTLGRNEAHEESLKVFEEKIAELENYLTDLYSYKDKILKQQRDDIYKMVKLLVKWVLLKEVKEDSYLKNLFEKLIHELQTKSNLLVKVNAENFSSMPDVIKLVEDRLGKLQNIRVEVEPDISYPGLIVESENGIVDGSLESQFLNLDKLFLSVGLEDNAQVKE